MHAWVSGQYLAYVTGILAQVKEPCELYDEADDEADLRLNAMLPQMVMGLGQEN